MNTLSVLPRALARPITATTSTSTPLIFTRGEATSRRLTKKLRLGPHPTMIVGGHGGVAPTASPPINHIIHNPSSAAPSVFATPNLFLPKEDPRRDHYLAINRTAVRRGKVRLPPPVSEPYEKKYHLTEADFEEIRRLRAEDPNKWTRRKLAEKFGTSRFFVGMVAETTPERKEEMQGRLAKIKGRWGKIRTTARLERAKRRSGWGGADGQ